MVSELQKRIELSAIEAIRQMTPEERLEAFLVHCELMMELYLAGQALDSARD
jgi:hypothetical protein